MAFDFPATPSVGQVFGNYIWDGEKWKLQGGQAVGAVRYDMPQILSASQQAQARSNIAAPDLTAMAYSGLQVNGNFEVSQEISIGTATNWVASTSGLASKYFCDNWIIANRGTHAGGVALADQRATTGNTFPGLNFLALVTPSIAQASLGANDCLYLYTPIEGYRVAKLNWGYAAATPLSLGFLFFPQGVGGTFSGTVRNAGVSRSYPFTFTAPANTITYVKVTIPPDVTGGTSWNYTNGTGMYLSICLASGSAMVGPPGVWASASYVGATGTVNGIATVSGIAFYVGNVVVLPGIELPSAERAPYIMRPYDQELLTCQRYYFKDPWIGYAAYGDANVPLWIPYRLPTTMRVTPTFAFSGGSSTGIASLGLYGGSETPSGFSFVLTADATAGHSRRSCIGVTMSADARL